MRHSHGGLSAFPDWSPGGMENIKQHTFSLARYTYTALSSLRYPNGAPVVRLYTDTEFSSPEVQGPIINFNVLDDRGNVVGYSQVGFSLPRAVLFTAEWLPAGAGRLSSWDPGAQGLCALGAAVVKPWHAQVTSKWPHLQLFLSITSSSLAVIVTRGLSKVDGKVGMEREALLWASGAAGPAFPILECLGSGQLCFPLAKPGRQQVTQMHLFLSFSLL